ATQTAISPGTTCATGGVMVSIGPDTNNNGVLDTSEIASQQAICNGAVGPQGPAGVSELVVASQVGAGAACAFGGVKLQNGIDGLTQLVKTKVLAAGSACATGGVEVDIGFDVNDDGVLQAAEIASTQDICNGANGANGSNGTNGTNGKTELATVSSIAAGS